MLGPDPSEQECPHAYEDIDEHLQGRGRAEDPARLVLDPLGGGVGEDERLGNAAARYRCPVGLY